MVTTRDDKSTRNKHALSLAEPVRISGHESQTRITPHSQGASRPD